MSEHVLGKGSDPARRLCRGASRGHGALASFLFCTRSLAWKSDPHGPSHVSALRPKIRHHRPRFQRAGQHPSYCNWSSGSSLSFHASQQSQSTEPEKGKVVQWHLRLCFKWADIFLSASVRTHSRPGRGLCTISRKCGYHPAGGRGVVLCAPSGLDPLASVWRQSMPDCVASRFSFLIQPLTTAASGGRS